MQTRRRATSCRARAEGERQGETEIKEARRDEERRSDGGIRSSRWWTSVGESRQKKRVLQASLTPRVHEVKFDRIGTNLIWIVQVSLI